VLAGCRDPETRSPNRVKVSGDQNMNMVRLSYGGILARHSATIVFRSTIHLSELFPRRRSLIGELEVLARRSSWKKRWQSDQRRRRVPVQRGRAQEWVPFRSPCVLLR